MVKVLLVDDETIARINLRCLINWEKEGCVICGEADSGPDALSKARELNPDIIFTDMNMAGMNGVEFIKNMRKISPSVRIIAFSAFDDFEYVRQSLKEGALDYLVKHRIDAESLLAILNTVKESLRKESIEKQRMDKAMTMASSGKALMKKDFLTKVLNGYVKENFEEIMREYDICLDERNLVVAAARIDDYYLLKEKFTAQEFMVFLETVENILSNLCSEMGKTEYVYIDDGKFAFVMSFAGTASEAQINSNSVSNVCNFEATVKRFLNITMSFGISSICPSFTKLGEYYMEACAVLENGYYKGSSYIVQKNELPKDCASESFNGLNVLDEKNIISYIRGMKRESVMHLLDEIFKRVKEKRASYNSIKMISVEMINILERLIKELGIPSNLVYPDNVNPYDEITRFRTMDELCIWFKKLYATLVDAYEKNSLDEHHSPIIKKAVEFIFKNYDRDISLSDVSHYVDVSPQYLSKLFKDECGKGFVNYLNNIRIEQAKRMLTEGVKLKDLAERTGFNNYTYFFTVFKEITGMTPQQYEKRAVSRND